MENFIEDADESGPVSKSVNAGHCSVPSSKSEQVGTHGLLQWFVQVPPSFQAEKVPKALPRVTKVELLLSYHSTIAAPKLRLGNSLSSAQSMLSSSDESLQTGQG